MFHLPAALRQHAERLPLLVEASEVSGRMRARDATFVELSA